MAPIWHAFASSSYLPPVSNISVYSDAINRDDVYSRTPDFSEFKDPWEEYSPQNDSFPTDDSALSDKNDNYYCGAGYEKMAADVDRQNDHNTSKFEHNQQFHYEQHFSYAPKQTQYSLHPTNNEHNQHQGHATSYSEESHSQRQVVQHTEDYWQQYQPSEQRHHPEQHGHKEQKQHSEQYQQHHHEQKHHNEPHHYNEQRQHSEHHQHSRQSHQHDYYKMDDHHIQHQSVHEQPHSTETWRENHAQHASDQTAHYQSHTVSHNDSHPQHHIQNSTQDNFTSHCRQSNEKNSEQSSETANKQTDPQRINFHPSPPAPCTDLHNVAMRSDPNITEHLDNANVSNCSRIFFFFKFAINNIFVIVRLCTYFRKYIRFTKNESLQLLINNTIVISHYCKKNFLQLHGVLLYRSYIFIICFNNAWDITCTFIGYIHLMYV